MVDTGALQSGDLAGAIGINKFNLGLGALGNVLFWVLLVFMIGIVVIGIIAFIVYRRTYSQNVKIFGLIGNNPTLKLEDKAKVVRFGGAGDSLFYLQKRKKYIAPPTIQMGRNTWWYWERKKDSELINIGLANIDEQMQQAGVYYVDTDVRMQRLGIEKNLRDRFQNTGFWQKYGTQIVGAIFVILITVALVVLFAKLVDVAKALESTAGAVRDMALSVRNVSLYTEQKTSSLVPASASLIPLIFFSGLKRRKEKW